ncbi:MAG TPA: SDR family NAD(P)-dependent oxidoreductase [Steroidobacteraceae bacterium]|nr:SDR family NAD(P)-dependent oxidoreductase [Steroidobacteraceae bacterium]
MKRIFLTGVSSGIGLCVAKALCQRGHQVWGTSRSRERLPDLSGFRGVVLDLNDDGSIDAGFREALAAAGEFDVLINNAGAGMFGPIEGFTCDELRSQFQTLLVGPLHLIALALPAMRASDRGLIINISSLAGELPVPFLAPYSAGKSALSTLSDGLNLELAHTGIRVVDVRPGDFATAFHPSTRRVGDRLSDAYAPNLEIAWRAIDRNMARAPDPQLLANAVVRIIDGEIRRPAVAVGDLFQARIAIALARRSLRAWVHWGLRKYYGLRHGR